MLYPFMFCCESVNFFPCGPLVFKNSHRCPPRQLMSVDSLCPGGLPSSMMFFKLDAGGVVCNINF